MRLPAIIFCLAFLAAGCSSSGSKTPVNEATENVSISEENLTLIHFNVKGMTCEGCENAIVASINKLDGIQEATASHTQEEATVAFDSTKTNIQAIALAIEEAGYSVEGEPSQPPH